MVYQLEESQISLMGQSKLALKGMASQLAEKIKILQWLYRHRNLQLGLGRIMDTRGKIGAV